MANRTQRVAVMVTDIVGYSAFMHEDVRKAMLILEKNRKIHRAAIQKYGGKFIKEVGDGILSIYENSLDAVRCAMEIRRMCCREADLQLRIGIHSGDVIIRYSDILGDGVNIASILEAEGAPEGIFLSENVYKDVRHLKDIGARFFAEKIIQHFPEPIRIFTIPAEKRSRKLMEEPIA